MGVPFEQIFFIRIVHVVMLLLDGIIRWNGCDIFKGVNQTISIYNIVCVLIYYDVNVSAELEPHLYNLNFLSKCCA
jgi:hypothetical protein